MKLLAIRFSAFGDVAMTVPVIDALARRYPALEITVLSRPFMQPLFAGMPANVAFRGVNPGDYKGVGGLFRLFRMLKKEGGYEAVADLHDVLRSKVLRAFFAWAGLRTAHIDKGRRGRKLLTRPRQKVLRQLPTSFERYEQVFARLGYPVKTVFRSIYGEGKGDAALFREVAGEAKSGRWIGIAPFAAHQGKMLPRETAARLVRLCAEHPGWTVFLFGGGQEERALLEKWAEGLPNVHPVAGRLKLAGELSLMSHLDVMVSMDSANMHLASLAGVPVVSVWGATHPLAGFMGWGQSVQAAVQADLPCRPCSIFGNRPCLRKDYACLAGLTAGQVLQRVESLLSQSEE